MRGYKNPVIARSVSDEAISGSFVRDCFASLAMTIGAISAVAQMRNMEQEAGAMPMVVLGIIVLIIIIIVVFGALLR